jgi:hypothetical protein
MVSVMVPLPLLSLFVCLLSITLSHESVEVAGVAHSSIFSVLFALLVLFCAPLSAYVALRCRSLADAVLAEYGGAAFHEILGSYHDGLGVGFTLRVVGCGNT